MKLIEKWKASWKTIKSQPKGERFSYFWEYYKWPAIIAVVLVVALICAIVGAITRKETVFSGYVLNSNAVEKDAEFLQGFYEYAGIDSETQEAAIYTDMYLLQGRSEKNMEVFQRIIGGISVGDADFVAAPPEPFQMCAYNTARIFKDLRDFLDEETLEQFSGRIYYIDEAVLEKLSAPVGEAIDASKINYPKDPCKPETMERPIPVGIAVGDRTAFQSSYYFYPDTEVYLGVITSTPRAELTRLFIDYMFS